jgi:pyruvate formate lyase activating enzyme
VTAPHEIDRRTALRCGLLGAGAAALGLVAGRATAKEAKEPPAHPADWWEPLEGKQVRCLLCPRRCVVADRERGTCGVRENRGGKYVTLVHSRPCAVHSDPIEKKPLFHVLPGTTALSIATAGCNMECRFCQNWEISQFRPEQVRSYDLPPDRIAKLASQRGDATIAYTYTEPVVFAEYVRDCAKAGRARGVGSVMISNGYIEEKPLRDLIPHLTAVKIDLKAFTERFYEKLCSGRLAPVLKTLEILKETGIWFEIVVLIVPTHNDDLEEGRRMFRWIREHLGDEVPVHLTRFHPGHAYKMKNLHPTPVKTLDRLRAAALEAKLRHVYVGNVRGHASESTRCAGCGETVVRRHGYRILGVAIEDGKCRHCRRPVPGVWSPPPSRPR